MLTVSDEEDDLYEAIKAGATGYLLKEISIEEVADAVRAVIERPEPDHARRWRRSSSPSSRASPRRRRPARPSPGPALTDRELEVLKLVAQGMSNREIAGELYISENTVKNHVRNILEKLHLHSRMEAVLYAVREKILDI